MQNKLDFILLQELAQIIEQGKKQVVARVNSTITLVYWQIGNRINTELLNNQRAEYGKETVSNVSKQLQQQYGKSYTVRNVRRMMQFAEEFPDFEIVSSVMSQLSWTHFIQLLPLKTVEQKMFYISKISEENWSVRETRKQIERKAFERKEIAKTQIMESSEKIQNSF